MHIIESCKFLNENSVVCLKARVSFNFMDELCGLRPDLDSCVGPPYVTECLPSPDIHILRNVTICRVDTAHYHIGSRGDVRSRPHKDPTQKSNSSPMRWKRWKVSIFEHLTAFCRWKLKSIQAQQIQSTGDKVELNTCLKPAFISASAWSLCVLLAMEWTWLQPLIPQVYILFFANCFIIEA